MSASCGKMSLKHLICQYRGLIGDNSGKLDVPIAVFGGAAVMQ